MYLKLKTFVKKKIIYNIASPILSKIRILKNKHEGETCYLFGDGVSIKYFDLSSFADKISFSLNWISVHKEFKELNCKYAFNTMPYFFYPRFTHPYTSNSLQKIYRNFINENDQIKFFVNLSNYPVLRNSNVFHLFNKIPDKKNNFLNDCYLNNINIFTGVFRYSISLAIYMGFKEIYLIGCDYTNKIIRRGHWYEKREGIPYAVPDYEKKFLNIVSKYVKITSINLIGDSFNIPSISYSSFTGKKPKYRENTELVDISILKKLSKCSAFKIF